LLVLGVNESSACVRGGVSSTIGATLAFAIGGIAVVDAGVAVRGVSNVRLIVASGATLAFAIGGIAVVDAGVTVRGVSIVRLIVASTVWDAVIVASVLLITGVVLHIIQSALFEGV
jgi:hypothetical protein